ncbi:hypothetical protein FA95DRAFT_994024 [Auriscalpium vulgare]|uniref:Uncharacterized protein n=1 Tax=Auriscalpium vulgare TaxID=40419 RepID=A0ACB8R6Z0_9AGAM|nr:hypothetical protein FA95DRAFT_994024 [Auriscalpium vulgare]
MEISRLPVYPLKRPLALRQTSSSDSSLSESQSLVSSTQSQAESSSTSEPPITSSTPPTSTPSSAPPSSSTSLPSSSDPPPSSSLPASSDRHSSSALTTSSTSSSEVSTSQPVSDTPTTTTSAPPLTPASSSSPVSLSSGFIFTTFTSSIATEINGTPTTIVTPIVTSLRDPSSNHTTSRHTAIMVGSAIGGAALLIGALAALFFLRRRANKRRYSFLARKPLRPREAFLAGEDMDDPPEASPGYQDDPFAHGDQYALPPRLMRARASESGSIFQEGVWPPPAAGSRLADPIVSAGKTDDLSRIVDDVMGPSTPPRRGDGHETPRLRGGSWGMSGSRESIELHGFGVPALAVTQSEHGRDASMGSHTQLLLDTDHEGNSPSPLTLTLTNPDPEEPLTPPAVKNWLQRSPNHSPKALPKAHHGD